MKRTSAIIAVTLIAALAFDRAVAQVPELAAPGSLPIEINADGETRFENGIAIADRNVSIEFGTTSVFADRAEFNPKTKDLTVTGNVRIYQDGDLFVGEKAIYNIDTKAINADQLSGGSLPFLFKAETFKTEAEDFLRATNARVTTHDSSKPDFNWRARTVRIYPDDRIVFSNVTWFVGKTPILWLPYLYQSLEDAVSFSISPGYSNLFGAYLLTRYSFPIGDNMSAVAKLDLMADRGIGVGLDGEYKFGKKKESWVSFQSYFLEDNDPNINETALARAEIDSTRYRASLRSRAYITDDIYANVVFNKLSDEKLLEDFFESDFRLDPQPETFASITKWDENYTVTLTGKAQINDFFDTTTRLPEVAVDVKRIPLGDSGVFYQGEASYARLERLFEEDSIFPDYDAGRLDTFHQIVYPTTIGGWLSVVPRAGVRLTYYDQTGYTEEVIEEVIEEVEVPSTKDGADAAGTAKATKPTIEEEISYKLRTLGSDSRAVFHLGLESSFKISKTWSNVQNRALGLDGLRHIVQPYVNFSYVSDPSLDPEDVLQFDRLIPSTQLNPLDFPQFVSIDAIDQWTIARLGVRNRLLTRRGDRTHNWLELDTFADINIDNPYSDNDVSNLFNNLVFRPVPWATLTIGSQLPVLNDDFTEVNTSLYLMANKDLSLSLGHRYIDGNPFFEDSSLLTFGVYWRINDHWAFSAYEQFEMDDSTLQSQSYVLHRDLSSWVASIGAVVRDNGDDKSEFAFLLSLTLKELPELSLPLTLGSVGRADGY